jgi:phosphoserine phosphatase
VFCDVDETLINCKTMFDFLDFYLTEKYGEPGARRAERTRRNCSRWPRQACPVSRRTGSTTASGKGERARAVERGRTLVGRTRSARPGLPHRADVAELENHRSAGALIVLVSGSFPAILAPIAAARRRRPRYCAAP